MSNYNFDEVLRKFNNNPGSILDKYTYERGAEICDRLNSADRTDLGELNDILNKIVLWKINRTVHVADATLNALYNVRTIQTVNEAYGQRRTEVVNLLISLLNSKGVRLAMASTFLHFFNPNVFPIFDQRAYRVIYLNDYQASTIKSENANLYMDYLEKCESYYNQKLSNSGISFSEIDKYLYQLDIEAGNKVKNYGKSE